MTTKNIYNNCITNLACTILKEFNLEHNHNTINELDIILKKHNFKNIIILLCDGMGSNILNNILNEDDFLRKYKLKDYYSVHPSTTTAATTSIISGLNPVEHGWLGWNIFVEPENKIVTMYTNTLKDTENQAATYKITDKYFPYQPITEKINNKKNCYANSILPFKKDAYKDFDDMLNKINNELNTADKNYIYAYYTNPDSLLHEFGVGSQESVDEINKINKKIENFSKKLKNTLLIVTADHGHKNCTQINLSNYPNITNKLNRETSIEGRFCSFSVLKNEKKSFEREFMKTFGKNFCLKTKEEIIDEKIFGDGNMHPLFNSAIQDYVAIATGNIFLVDKEKDHLHKSVHAGISDDEMIIPLITFIS